MVNDGRRLGRLVNQLERYFGTPGIRNGNRFIRKSVQRIPAQATVDGLLPGDELEYIVVKVLGLRREHGLDFAQLRQLVQTAPDAATESGHEGDTQRWHLTVLGPLNRALGQIGGQLHDEVVVWNATVRADTMDAAREVRLENGVHLQHTERDSFQNRPDNVCLWG